MHACIHTYIVSLYTSNIKCDCAVYCMFLVGPSDRRSPASSLPRLCPPVPATVPSPRLSPSLFSTQAPNSLIFPFQWLVRRLIVSKDYKLHSRRHVPPLPPWAAIRSKVTEWAVRAWQSRALPAIIPPEPSDRISYRDFDPSLPLLSANIVAIPAPCRRSCAASRTSQRDTPPYR